MAARDAGRAVADLLDYVVDTHFAAVLALDDQTAGDRADGVAAGPGGHHLRHPPEAALHRLNVIMKQVTSWAAIIAVSSAVTGFYSQNVPYPGFGHPIGFWTSTKIVTVGLSGVLWLMFRRKDWI